MGKLVMWNMMTLDGMFEGPQPWDLGFHDYAFGDELRWYSVEVGREAGALVFGRRTYEGMAAHWPTAKGETAEIMNALPKYVFSRTLERADWNNSTLIGEDARGAVARLKEEQSQDLFVFGSADLSATLIRGGLFDEYRIGLVSLVLGEGTPLFKPGSQPVNLHMVESRPLGDRCQLLRYQPGQEPSAAL